MSPLKQAIHAVRAARLTVVKEGVIQTSKAKMDFTRHVDVCAVLDPILQEHGLAVGFETGAMVFGASVDATRMDMVVTKEGSDEEHRHTFEIALPADMKNDRGMSISNHSQRHAMARTFGRRTELILFFNMVAGKEDELEHLQQGQMRPQVTGATVSDLVPWATLMEGGWRELPGPDGTTLYGEMTAAERMVIWRREPENKALCAWMADRVTYVLEQLNMPWAEFQKGRDLPAKIEDCGSSALGTALSEVLKLTGDEKPKPA